MPVSILHLATVTRQSRNVSCPSSKAFPKLKMVMAHMGGWKQVAAFIDHAVGMDVYIDTSFTLGYCTQEQIAEIFLKHSTDRILFATDTPWGRNEAACGIRQFLAFVR